MPPPPPKFNFDLETNSQLTNAVSVLFYMFLLFIILFLQPSMLTNAIKQAAEQRGVTEETFGDSGEDSDEGDNI